MTKADEKYDNCIYGVQSDCFACSGGKCRILTDTDFRRGICPFYKSHKKAADDRAKAQARLKREGLEYLADRYKRF